MIGYHVTTTKKLERYKRTGGILPPVRFWPNDFTAKKWARKTLRDVILRIECIDSESQPIGLQRNIKPSILEIPLHVGTTIVIYTDGLAQAGEVVGESLDICTTLLGLLDEQSPTAQYIADMMLNQAIRLDQGRPNDDMSIVVLRVLAMTTDHIRRMTVRFPVD